MHPPSLPSSSSPPLLHRVPPFPNPNRPHPHSPRCACPGRAWRSTIAMGWATSMITLSGGARPTVGIYLIGAVVAAVAAEVSVIERNTESMSETKKYRVTQQKDANAIIARRTTATEFNVQVERPPKFTMLPLGASKLAKNRKTNLSAKEVNTPEGGGGGG